MGETIRRSGSPREDIFVTSKLWNSDHGYDKAIKGFETSAARIVESTGADPQQAVLEMARVTRSGGRVVAFEPEWGKGALDADDRAVTRAVLNYRCDSIRNGWSGRQLPRLFCRAELTEVMVEATTSTQTDHARWVALWEIETYARRAQEAGLVTAEAADTWLEQLAQAGQEGTFFCSATSFLVSARKA